jgi:hypothetical protein
MLTLANEAAAIQQRITTTETVPVPEAPMRRKRITTEYLVEQANDQVDFYTSYRYASTYSLHTYQYP